MTDQRPETTTPFVQLVVAERARLALVDPEGEREAVVPLDGVRARQTLLGLTHSTGRPPRRIATAFAVGGRRMSTQEIVASLEADPHKKSGRVPCPAHGGGDRNLAWRLVDDRVLLKCWSHECTFESILDAIR